MPARRRSDTPPAPRLLVESSAPQPPVTGKTHTIPEGALPYRVDARLVPCESRADRDGDLTLEINDPHSSRRILEIKLDSLALATLLTRHGSTVAMLTHVQLDALGWHHHHDTVLVPDDDAHAEANLRAFEHDGWRCSRADYGNHHRWERIDGVAYYRVARSRIMPTPQRETPAHLDYEPYDAPLGVALDIAARYALRAGESARAYRVREFVKRLARATGGDE